MSIIEPSLTDLEVEWVNKGRAAHFWSQNKMRQFTLLQTTDILKLYVL